MLDLTNKVLTVFVPLKSQLAAPTKPAGLWFSHNIVGYGEGLHAFPALVALVRVTNWVNRQ